MTLGDFVWYHDRAGDHIAQIIWRVNDQHVWCIVYQIRQDGIPSVQAAPYYDPMGQRDTSWRYLDKSLVTDEGVQVMPTKTEIKRSGYDMAQALRQVFGGGNYADNPAAVFALGKAFAGMSQQASFDGGIAFIEGFMAGFQSQVARITAPDDGLGTITHDPDAQ